MALEPDQVYTLTTLTSGVKGFYEMPPNSKPFPKPYFDDYEDYEEHGEPHYFVPQSGVWEIRKEAENSHNKVNLQVVLRKPIDWCYVGDYTISVGGDYIWKDVVLNIRILVPSLNGTTGTFLAARIKKGGCEVESTGGLFFAIYPTNSSYAIYCSLDRRCTLTSGKVDPPVKYDTWHKFGMIVKESDVTVSFDEKILTKAKSPNYIRNGFVGYGTTTFGYANFDDMKID